MPAAPFRRIVIRFAGVVVLTLATVGAGSASLAQSAGASTLKAAYVVNFVKFTEWTDLANGQPIRLCVVSDGPMVEAMTRAARDTSVAGHAIDVSSIAGGAAVKDCDMLFVSLSDAKAVEKMLADARTRRVLTVSDGHLSANPGAIIELFTEDGRLRFAVDIDGMTRSGIKISSRLLSLAQITHTPGAR
jgi:hypothetical protein